MELCLVTDHDCNLRCDYCYAGRKLRRPMSRAVAERAIDLALGLDPTSLSLSFFGGEPLLEVELIEHATDYARRRLAELGAEGRLFVSLNTNATLVDERVEALVERCRPLTAFVSLDGPREVHDRHRRDAAGCGSHARVKEGIRRLAAAGAEIVAAGVINPDTGSSLGEVAVELLSLPIFVATLTPNLRAAWDQAALGGLREGLEAAAEVWAEAFRAGRCVRFEPMTTKILSHLHAAMPCASRCQLEGRELVVAPSGRLYPCGELVGEDQRDQFVIGDVADGLSAARLKSLRETKDRVESKCQDCPIRERCASSCGCIHVALTGAMGDFTDTLCELEASFIEAADRVAEELYRESCPAFLEFFYRQSWDANPTASLVQLRRGPAPRPRRA
jgi:uncharacterized protein